MTLIHKKENRFVWAVFWISVIVRTVLGCYYPRTVNCYPDEALYLSAAASVEPAQGFGIQSADRLWKDRLFASDRTGICLFKSQGADYGHRLYQCAGHVLGTFSG